jgi:hypothetical protein
MKYKIRAIVYSAVILSIPSNGFSEPQSCLACRFPMSNESSKAGQTDACDDLFGSACLGSGGKLKYQDASKKLPEELSKPIREARNKTAQAMGFKDIDDAVKTKLKEAGIVLKDPPDPEAWKGLIGEADASAYSSDNAKNLYASVEQCDKDLKELKAVLYYSITDATPLKELVGKYESFQARYKEQSIKLYSKDLPNFISSHIGKKCSTLKSNPSNYKTEENKEITQSCGNISQIKRRAVELFRAEGTDGYDKLAEQFVAENMLPEAKYYSPPYTPATPPTTPPPEKTEVEKLRDKVSGMNSSISRYCYDFSSNTKNAAKKVVADLMKQVSKSKTTVDGVIDSFYSKDREKLANEIYRIAKSDIQDLTRSFVKDPQKRGDILDGYDNLKLYWMKKPDDSAYTKDKDGRLVLDEDKVSPNPTDQTSSVFFDPNLSFFTTLNAFYTPSVSYGKVKGDEQVNMMPAFVSMLDKNPYAFLTTVAHESGHKIGQMVSKINGYDLSSEYKDLLACYKDNKSIKLEDNQADETLADYFSSEVLARQIQKLPQDKRKQAMMSSMEGYCIFDDSRNHQQSISCKGDHPESSLRVSGIFGANPSIRKILGCEKDSPKFKTCGLKNSILDATETNKSTGSPVLGGTEQSDSKSSKGVR